MSKMNELVQNIFPDKKKAKIISVIFFSSIVFEFAISYPIYCFFSKTIGVLLLLVTLAVFIGVDIYIFYRLASYAHNKAKN
jgi:hypothetical protein